MDTLAATGAAQTLEFVFDYTFADNPVATAYEPISRISNDYALWGQDFLELVGYNSGAGGAIFNEDIRQFNHAQRTAHDTDWAFAMFVVNSELDADDSFAAGGSFSRAFAFAGGLFFVSPSDRPASTFSHETGHIFYAKDEYLGAGSYLDFRGYYNTQNLNAANNPDPDFVQADSIMATGQLLENAYANHTSSHVDAGNDWLAGLGRRRHFRCVGRAPHPVRLRLLRRPHRRLPLCRRQFGANAAEPESERPGQ